MEGSCHLPSEYINVSLALPELTDGLRETQVDQGREIREKKRTLELLQVYLY